jgi:hypothetical protein
LELLANPVPTPEPPVREPLEQKETSRSPQAHQEAENRIEPSLGEGFYFHILRLHLQSMKAPAVNAKPRGQSGRRLILLSWARWGQRFVTLIVKYPWFELAARD